MSVLHKGEGRAQDIMESIIQKLTQQWIHHIIIPKTIEGHAQDTMYSFIQQPTQQRIAHIILTIL
jgi:hypothetical protein